MARTLSGERGQFKAAAAKCACIGDSEVIIPTETFQIPRTGPCAIARQAIMLTHAQIWNALDRLAARNKLTASGLAKKAGLDPTTFNKSKRITPEGRPRWPSTELVAKALAATSTKVDTFVTLITDGGKPPISTVPLIGFAAGRRRRLFRRWRLPGRQRLGGDRRSRRSPTSTPMRWRFPATR